MMVQAYLEKLSFAPGESLRVHASGSGGCTGDVRRLLHSDPHPVGPGEVAEQCEWGRLTFTPALHEPAQGSFGSIERCFSDAEAITISLWHCPTDLSRDSVILSWQGAEGAWTLGIEQGRLSLTNGRETVRLGAQHRERQWYFLGCCLEPATSERALDAVTVFSGPWGRTGGPFTRGATLAGAFPRSASALGLGAPVSDAGLGGTLDGKVAGLRLDSGSLDVVQLMFLMNGQGSAPRCSWDFANRDHPDVVSAQQDGVGDLVLFHAPVRGGEIPGPVADANHPLVDGGSVHFHSDDTEDCAWPEVVEITIPTDVASGFYSLRLADPDGVFELPFVVSGRASVTLLAPTLSWQAYSNLGRDPSRWVGRSHYELHADGSPVVITTCRKPTQTFAPSARLEVDADDGFAHGANVTHLLMADLYAEYWLHQLGSHAVMDDRDLHFGGVGTLDGVRVLVLSAHPEYWTSAMLDALEGFISRGGNIIYLGGNGLYWVTSLHPTKPHLMEVRRWGGSQTCSVSSGDRTHQFEDRVGGLLANAGRPPNRSVGVEFTGFGAGESMVYERTEASFLPAWDWVFDGVESSTVGAGGLNSGAGNEFDRVEATRPGPGVTSVLATSRPTSSDHFSAYEQGAHVAPNDVVRADMAMTETPHGGLVFSLGSITAGGCLPIRGSDLATVCTNVLRRMLRLAPDS